MRFTTFLIGAALLIAGCSKSNSPTAPTPTPSAAATRIIAISGSLAFGDVTVGSSRDLTFTVTNSGNSALTISGAQGPSGSAQYMATGSANAAIQPGATHTVTVRFTPTAAGAVSGTLTLTGDHTSGTNTIAFSGNGVVPTATVVGVVRDASTNNPLGGVTVRVAAGVALNRSASTDGNGYYSIPGVSGALTLTFSLSGYDTVSRPTTVNGDTRFDTTMTRSGPVAAALEYRVTGTGAAISASTTYSNCSAGTSQQSDAPLPWSFTCSSVPTGQFVYISAQNLRNSGCVKVQILKRGTLYRESESCGAFVIATASGSY